MSESERQSATIHSDTNEYMQKRKVCKQKKKIIKKQRAVGENTLSNKLTKQERMRIQKQKNRQAAQRSRDQHKQYVNSLEMEVRHLKQQVQINKNICYKCKAELTNNPTFFEETIKKQDIFEQDLFINVQPQQPSQDCHSHLSDHNQDVAEFFLRPKEPQEDYSYLKMMLFVAMIVVAVIIFPTNPNPTENSRNLVEIYKTSQSPPAIKDQFTIISSDDTGQLDDFKSSNALVIRNQQINQQCLDSLLDYKSYSLTNLRAAQMSYDSPNQGILLCSFEQPSKHQSKQRINSPSKFLRLFMIGAQIKQMMGRNSPINSFLHNKLQLNGIYKIGAEIRQVQLISQHNCLL